jgi:hypothetical protein
LPFLNANSARSLGELLQNPIVHFKNPFTFPQYNIGSQSAISIILFRLLAPISLYWSVPIVVLLFDLLFLIVFGALVALVFPDAFRKTLAWAMLSMSVIFLTSGSVSAFNMQGYVVVILGLYATELLLQGHYCKGVLTLCLSFLGISQGYPLGFFLPYYILVWVLWRLSTFYFSVLPNVQARAFSQLLRNAILSLSATGAVVCYVHYASNYVYLKKISFLNPHGIGNQFEKLLDVYDRFKFFFNQALWPSHLINGVPLGFGPYGLLFVILATSIAGLLLNPRAITHGLQLLELKISMAIIGTAMFIGYGYSGSFLSPVVKSQRAIFGDVFLIFSFLLFVRPFLSSIRRKFFMIIVITITLLCTDFYYLYTVLSVSHQKNHSPVFDFDLNDGIVRHDMISAARAMKEQVIIENKFLVIYYPYNYSENSTDPAVFFAHFLRNYGNYQNSKDVFFPAKWCVNEYGCPFPELSDPKCRKTYCLEDPSGAVAAALKLGRIVSVWSWKNSRTHGSLEIAGIRLLETTCSTEKPELNLLKGWACFQALPAETPSTCPFKRNLTQAFKLKVTHLFKFNLTHPLS